MQYGATYKKLLAISQSHVIESVYITPVTFTHFEQEELLLPVHSLHIGWQFVQYPVVAL